MKIQKDKYKAVIGLGTCLRPVMLRECLTSLTELLLPDDLDVCLIVVDNDHEKSAFTVYREFEKKLKFDSLYVSEPERGIVCMRNRVLEKAIELKADFVAFIDDDERVIPEWLQLHFLNLRKYEADVTVGSVVRILPEETPKWIIEGKFFERPDFATGTQRRSASTSNVLFSIRLCREWGLRFHPALNFIGSSDTYFFGQAYERGAKIIWVKEAEVSELIPGSRLTLKWILQRSFRYANARVARNRLSQRPLTLWVRESVYGLGKIAEGLCTLPVHVLMGKAKTVRSLRALFKGLGTFSGLLGLYYQEYRNIHGN